MLINIPKSTLNKYDVKNLALAEPNKWEIIACRAKCINGDLRSNGARQFVNEYALRNLFQAKAMSCRVVDNLPA